MHVVDFSLLLRSASDELRLPLRSNVVLDSEGLSDLRVAIHDIRKVDEWDLAGVRLLERFPFSFSHYISLLSVVNTAIVE